MRFYQLLSQQYYAINPCSTNTFGVILPHREFVCTAESLHSTLQTLQANRENYKEFAGEKEFIELLDNSWDHQYRPLSAEHVSESMNLPYLVIYGTLRSSSLCQFLSVATEFVNEQQIGGFSLRSSFHAMTPVSTTSVLQGYGVYLDIKNMEYHNFDDEDNAKKDKR